LVNLNEKLSTLEEIEKVQASGSSQTAYSFDEKYTIVEISTIFDLIERCRNGCTQCKGQLFITKTSMVGHGMLVSFQCNQCSWAHEWCGSSSYSDGSLVVNRDVTRAWYITGGDRSHYFEFTEALKCGQYNRTSFDNTIELLQPIILEQEEKTYRENIDLVNTLKDGVILGFDCQHSRSQRASGSAPYATTTFMCHNEGSYYGKILLQSHISKHQLKEMGKTGKESKDKITVDQGLDVMIEKLKLIQAGLCDGSSSGNKSFRDKVQSSNKFNNPPIYNCFWHKAKSLPNDFNRKLADVKKKLPQSEWVGNKKTAFKYPEFHELEITGKKIKSHFFRSQKNCKGNAKEMAEEFKGFSDFYQQLYPNTISETTISTLDQ
jgi:hypothetical protein